MTLAEMIEHCQKRGKMTALEAQKLRMSCHAFVGAFGTTPLSDLEIPRWMMMHCKKCDQADCPILKLM